MDSYIIDWRQPNDVTTEIRQFIDEDVIGGIADLLSNRLKLQEELIDALQIELTKYHVKVQSFTIVYMQKKKICNAGIT